MVLEFWERPRASAAARLHPADQNHLDDCAGALEPLLDAALRPPSDQRRDQTQRVADILAAAEETAVYRDTFGRAGIKARDFKSLSDIVRFPIITKQQLMNAYRTDCLHPRYLSGRTYQTWSSGSSGLTLPIEFNPEAVIIDTLQGSRQLALQSSGKVTSGSLAVHYYTCPWWTDNIARQWRTAFISSLVPVDEAAGILHRLRPNVLTGYPSILQLLARKVQPGDLPLGLVVTNSEQSTRLERDQLEAIFSCPVLDEYSSEELTRIAIELPDKRYYVCEDSVFLEVLHPETREPVPDGEWGEAVVTSLLNEAMPFIRYATGDLVRRPKNFVSPWRDIGWSPLEALGGRMLDSFIRPDKTMVPSGAMLDVIYRAFDEIGVCVERFELIQVSPSEARLNIARSRAAKADTLTAFTNRVADLLAFVLDTRVKLDVGPWVPADTPHGKEKRRPVRRAFAPDVPGCNP